MPNDMNTVYSYRARRSLTRPAERHANEPILEAGHRLADILVDAHHIHRQSGVVEPVPSMSCQWQALSAGSVGLTGCWEWVNGQVTGKQHWRQH